MSHHGKRGVTVLTALDTELGNQRPIPVELKTLRLSRQGPGQVHHRPTHIARQLERHRRPAAQPGSRVRPGDWKGRSRWRAAEKEVFENSDRVGDVARLVIICIGSGRTIRLSAGEEKPSQGVLGIGYVELSIAVGVAPDKIVSRNAQAKKPRQHRQEQHSPCFRHQKLPFQPIRGNGQRTQEAIISAAQKTIKHKRAAYSLPRLSSSKPRRRTMEPIAGPIDMDSS